MLVVIPYFVSPFFDDELSDLSMLLIFSKNQNVDLLTISIVILLFINFFTFIISFLLYILIYFVVLVCELRIELIYIHFFICLMKVFNIVNFPLIIAVNILLDYSFKY